MPKPNFIGFNNSLSGIGNAFAQRQEQEQKFKQAIQMMIFESQLKQHSQQQNPLQQLIERAEAAEAAQTLGNKGLYDQIRGTQQMPNAGNAGIPNISFGGQQQNMFQAQGQMQDYQMVPAGDLDAFGNPKMKIDLSPEAALRQKIAETKASELAKGVPTAESGKVALARESIKNIQDVKNILFPSGEAKSFKRNIAYGSNLPGGQYPLLPSVLPFAKNPQNVFRKVGAALSGRQLIQTGVAARPEETAKLMSQFAPNFFSDSDAAFDGLNELEKFYNDYLYIVETKGLQSADEWAKSKNINQQQLPRKQGISQQKIPKYNQQTQKLQQNKKTGEYRVVPR